MARDASAALVDVRRRRGNMHLGHGTVTRMSYADPPSCSYQSGDPVCEIGIFLVSPEELLVDEVIVGDVEVTKVVWNQRRPQTEFCGPVLVLLNRDPCLAIEDRDERLSPDRNLEP